MLDWYKELSSKERRTLWACFGGWALDAMDVQIYSLLIPTLIALWGLTKAEAGTLGTTALLVSALGGWITGILCDRFGRVRMLQITILWFAAFTFLSGFTNSYGQLLVVRSLQGLGFGGEWAAGSVLIGEIIRAKHRGKAVGYVQSGYAVGWGTAAVLATLFFTIMPETIAWRALFWIGAFPALLVFFVRRFVSEPEIFDRARRATPRAGGLLAIFSPTMLRTTVLTSLLALGVQGSGYAIVTWLPAYLKLTRGLSVFNTGAYLFVIIAGAFFGFIASAHLADRIGRRKNFVIFAVLCWGIVIGYTYLPISDPVMLFLGFPFGFFTTGIYSALGPYFTELFPTRIRATGQGFAYNFGRAAGSSFPWLVGVLSTSLPLGQAIGLLSLVGYALVLIAIFLLPETRGKELDAGEVESIHSAG